MNIAKAAAATAATTSGEAEFMQHVKDWKLEYDTHEEYKFRYQLWENKDQIIKQHNSKPDTSFKLGHNKFSTWTEDEIQKINKKPKLVSSKKRNLLQIEKPEFIYKPGAYGIDWRKKGVETDVQVLTQCADPAVYQAVDELQMAHAVRTGTMVDLSLQQMIDCYKQTNICDTDFIDTDPYTYIVESGLATEEDYPFTGIPAPCKPDIEQMTKITIEKMNYLDQEKTHPIHSQQLERALMYEPITVLVDASSVYFQGYSGGVIDTEHCGLDAHHPMIAVGWGVEDSGRQYYILKNTWGAEWGEKGYVNIAATFGGWGICGVQTSGTYPTTD